MMKPFHCFLLSLFLLNSSLNAQNVGIGTLSPVNRLSVVGKVNITDSLGVGTASPAAVLHLQSTNAFDVPRGDIIMSRFWNGNSDTRASAIFHYIRTSPSSDNLAFGVSGDGGSFLRPNSVSQIKMLIQANGNVGIGTTTPAEKLEVNGIIKTSGFQLTGVTGTGWVLKCDQFGRARWEAEADPQVGTLTNNLVPRWSDGSASLADGVIYDNGLNVGIGIISPAAKLHVKNTSTTALRIDGNTGLTAVSVGGTGIVGVDAPGVQWGRFVIQDDGDVGIGSPSPVTTLDVNGGIRTKHSGSSVVSVSAGTNTYTLTIPQLPFGWDYTNTVVMLSVADGSAGTVLRAKLTFTTTIDIVFQTSSTGFTRFNWIIFKM